MIWRRCQSVLQMRYDDMSLFGSHELDGAASYSLVADRWVCFCDVH
jgi:hypothetical protein